MASVVSDLAAGVFAGDARAVARAISLVEAEDPQGVRLIREIYSHTGGGCGRHHRAPGAGKHPHRSHRGCGGRQSVGVLAVDPTSPFTGGAMLGDRLATGASARRWRVHPQHGDARSSGRLAGADDAALWTPAKLIVVETVGVSQDESRSRGRRMSRSSCVQGSATRFRRRGSTWDRHIFVLNKGPEE